MRSELRVLSRDEIESIHAATLELLERVGVKVLHPEALGLLADAGASRVPGTSMVRIPGSLVTEAAKAAPKRWTWHARDPSRSFVVGDRGRTRLGPGSACTKVVDYETGTARSPTPSDGDTLVRLMDALEFVDINYTPVSYGPEQGAPVYHEVATMVRDLQNTSKVLVGPSFNGAMARAGLEVAALLAGGDEPLRKRPMVAGYCDPVGPLTHDRTMTETLMEYAALGQPVFLTCLDLAGASAPASLAGLLVQQNAEIMSGVLVAHLVNPAAPVVYGCVSGVMDMKAGSAAVGGPEAGLLSAAAVQLSHFYGLPCSTLGQSDAKVHDAQAALEKASTLLASMLAGADFVDLFFGSYDGFNATSPEQVIIDHEIAGYAHRYSQGIQVEPERLSLDLLEAVGAGGSFLREPRALQDTMARMKAEWYIPSLFSRRDSGGTAAAERTSLLEAAHRRAQAILADHAPTPLDPGILKGANVILDRLRRSSSPSPSG